MNIDRRTELALKPARATLTASLLRVCREATPAGWCALASAVAASAWTVSSIVPAAALVVYAVCLVALIAAAAIDVIEQRLPNVLTLGTATAGLVALPAITIMTGSGSPLRALAGGAIFGGWILFGALLVRDGYGLGDVKLAAACGILAGWLSWPALTVVIVVTQVAIVTQLLLGRFRGQQRVPLGAAFVVGLATALWSASIA